MQCRDRKGNEVAQNESQNKILAFLYESCAGNVLLSALVRPWASELGGKLLDLPVSRWYVPTFIRKNGIDMERYEKKKYRSYNDFFTRRIRPEYEKIDKVPEHLIAPCDSKLSVYPIREDSRFVVKETIYSMQSLFRSRKIAEEYCGGTMLIFRLTVDDYHHYCYVDEGKKTKNYHIQGVYHTVNPIANDYFKIYKENTREFSVLKSKNFGPVLMMEVGALMVGKIVNDHQEAYVCRGEEKGHFEFGGSTVILCLKKGQVQIDEDILQNSRAGIETVVKIGERIGEKIRRK